MSQSARTMAARRRRRIDVWVIVTAAVVVAVLAFLVAALSGGERVARLWVSATIAEDGSARIVEVIDYDFATEERRGIFRDVPGLRADDPVEVTSPDAPADVVVTGEDPVRLRIGDPDVTVSGQHRYELSYTLEGVVSRGGELAWNAVGTGWEVPIDDVEVHVLGAVELDADTCSAGDSGTTNGCALRQTAPGHLVARAGDLDPGQGVTVSATEGRALDAAPDAPTAPTAAPAEPGIDPLVPAVVAGLLALLAGALVSRVVRRAGREHVPSAGLPTVVPSSGGEARIDFEELGGFATPSASIPRDISPAQGGVLLTGSVAERHKVAWLVDLAVKGVVDLDPSPDGTRTTVTRRADGDPATARLLDQAFAGRQELRLGEYDESFAEAWTAVGTELDDWQQGSGLWDAAADQRAGRVRWLGVLAGLVGLVVVGVGAWLAGEQSTLPVVLAAAGGALAGGGISAALRAWELRVLTPQGSSTWLRVESLRRYFAECAPVAIDDALAAGTLGDYTAWALALGEAERWSKLAKSVKVPGRSGYDDRHWRYATYGPVFMTSCSSASTAPSSSSSGGGGGSVGGGAGGGGGGSW